MSLVLRFLVSACQDHDESIASLAEIDPISRAIIDLQFGNSFTHRLHNARIPALQPVQPVLDSGLGSFVLKTTEPLVESALGMVARRKSRNWFAMRRELPRGLRAQLAIWAPNFATMIVMEIIPQPVCYDVEPTLTGIRVSIPARKNWLVILFLLAWLGGWVAGETSAISQLLHPKIGPPQAFLAFWLIGWTIGGAAVMATLIWQVSGREVIAVEGHYLIHRVELLGMARSREYQGDLVSRLRAADYSPSLSRQGSWMPPLFGSGVGPIAFDFGSTSVRMGQSLSEAEAPGLVEKLALSLPRA